MGWLAVLAFFSKIAPLIRVLEKAVEDPDFKTFMLSLEQKFIEKKEITLAELYAEWQAVLTEGKQLPDVPPPAKLVPGA